MTSPRLTSDRLEFYSYSDAVESYMSRGWTDGLPIIPPTADRVSAFLDRAGLPPSEIPGHGAHQGPRGHRREGGHQHRHGRLPPRALSRGRRRRQGHDRAPVQPARHLGQHDGRGHPGRGSTGPVAREIGMNSGVSVFGPGNRANATIGRAIRLIQINATGAVPGELDKAALGHAGKYTWCIAEAEDASPWEPLHVERGFEASDSTISIFAGISPTQAGASGDTPESVLGSLGDALRLTGTGQQELVVVHEPRDDRTHQRRRMDQEPGQELSARDRARGRRFPQRPHHGRRRGGGGRRDRHRPALGRRLQLAAGHTRNRDVDEQRNTGSAEGQSPFAGSLRVSLRYFFSPLLSRKGLEWRNGHDDSDKGRGTGSRR